MATGAQFVMMAGVQLILEWFADSWDSLMVINVYILCTSNFICSAIQLAGCPYWYRDGGTGLIVLDNTRCRGSESRLVDCEYDPDTSEDYHYEDIGVNCGKYSSCNVKLL